MNNAPENRLYNNENLRTKTSNEFQIQFYKSMARSVLSYGSEVWTTAENKR
jgi:hypothetical protein